jgi:hypothetical protein
VNRAAWSAHYHEICAGTSPQAEAEALSARVIIVGFKMAVPEDLVKLVGWCQAELARLVEREQLISGKFQVFETHPSGESIDISEQQVARIEASIAELADLIAKHD